MNDCTKAVLVGLDEELPTDPSVAYSGEPPIIGCNHLVCMNCGADVRHADSRSTTTNDAPPEAELAVLYESSDPASSPLLNSAPVHRESRTYFCRCEWHAVNLGGVLYLARVDLPWKCSGHPDAVVVVDEARDIREAAARKATDALVAAAVPIPALGYKIRFPYAPRVDIAFSTASELRDGLLASYPDAAYSGARSSVRAATTQRSRGAGWRT